MCLGKASCPIKEPPLRLCTTGVTACRGARTRLNRLQKRLETGALTKFRLDSTGTASALYETELKPAHKIAVSGQFDATDLGKPPKVGFALDIKN